MIEVMVAALLLVLGGLALFQIVDASVRTSYRAEQAQVSSNLLQRELERVKGADRENFTVMSDDPNGCMNVEAMPDEFHLGRLDGTWGSSGVYDGLEIAYADDPENPGFPPCETVVSGDVTATVYRVITWFNLDDPEPDIHCYPPVHANDVRHDTTCGMKRIYIGVKPENSASGGDRGYREIQGEVIAFTAQTNFDDEGGGE